MSSWVKPLFVLLLVQLAVWALLQFSGGTAPEVASQLLDVNIDANAEVKLTIEDAEGGAVSVSRADPSWLLESGLPADSAKADALLTKLQALELSWPVSTNADSHERFEVAPDGFQRRLTLSTGGTDSTLYFGTSPGYEQVHARGKGDEVYAVKLANYELSAAIDEWLDKSLLQAEGEVTYVRWNESVSVEKTDEGWLLSGELANIEATKSAVNNVAQLLVLGVLESAPSAAPADAKVILLRDSVGEYRLNFWPREAKNDYVVMSTRFPGEAFRVANFIATQFVPELRSLEAPKVPQIEMQELLGPQTPAAQDALPLPGSGS